MNFKFDIPDIHLATLRRMCSQPAESELPEQLMTQYLLAKQAGDRIGMPLTDHDLLTVVMMSKVFTVPEPPPDPTAIAMWKAGELKAGDTVLCKWRNQLNRPAKLVGLHSDDRFIVRIEGRTEESKIAAEDISVPLT